MFISEGLSYVNVVQGFTKVDEQHTYLTLTEVHKLKILIPTVCDIKVCSFPHIELISLLYVSGENTLVNVFCSSA
jgi:hypothetical protein